LDKVVQTLASADWTSSTKSLDAAVEGTMAASVLSRLLSDHYSILPWEPLFQMWDERAAQVVGQLEPHQLSGLKWSYDCFQLLLPSSSSCLLPTDIQQAYDSLDLPFCIRPALLCHLGDDLSVSNFCDQVEFQRDAIQTTTTKRVVQERRQTAWEGDDYVAPFSYSGKSMQRKSWSPLVQQVRDSLNQQTGQYYDGCLLNLYPDGGSGMRYHMDPDQGTLWDYETAVVSVGATRRFAFRCIPDPNQNEDSTTTNNNGKKPHVFVLLHGDVTEMVDDCQRLFQHTVKTAEGKEEMAPRVSLVFKKTLASSSSRTTSGEQ
jgi:alkylated DNA repair dioxygenase AlkB